MTDDTLATKTTELTGFKTPHYYKHISGVECVQISKWLSSPLAQAFQYVWRCDNKHDEPLEDLKKALQWVQIEKSIDLHDYYTIPRGIGGKVMQLIERVNQKETDKDKAALLHFIGFSGVLGINRAVYLDAAINKLIAMIEKLES